MHTWEACVWQIEATAINVYFTTLLICITLLLWDRWQHGSRQCARMNFSTELPGMCSPDHVNKPLVDICSVIISLLSQPVKSPYHCASLPLYPLYVIRVLGMVDGAVLLVDAVEGPLAQTKFVVAKALARGITPIVLLTKVDREAATASRCGAVASDLFDLFASMGASDEQLDFPVLYASAKQVW